MPKKKRPPSRGDYEVGYRRPPKHSRFKPGQSGNPQGRPKKDEAGEDPYAVLDRILRQPLRPKDGGPSMTQLEAFFRVLLRDAIKGDAKARRLVLDFLGDRYPARLSPSAANDDDPADDNEVILDGFTRYLAMMTGPAGGDGE